MRHKCETENEMRFPGERRWEKGGAGSREGMGAGIMAATLTNYASCL